jgi:tryptophan-rich sensory protein
MKRTPVSAVLAVLAAIIICELAGGLGGVATSRSVDTWYVTLAKPSFNPPNWVFFPVWTILYALMGISAALVWWRGAKDGRTGKALLVFAVQLVLNVIWSFAFFGLRSPLAGFIVIILLWAAILWSIIYFTRISKLAGMLLVPYILWVTFAAVLNASLLSLNNSRTFSGNEMQDTAMYPVSEKISFNLDAESF